MHLHPNVRQKKQIAKVLIIFYPIKIIPSFPNK